MSDTIADMFLVDRLQEMWWNSGLVEFASEFSMQLGSTTSGLLISMTSG